jgi:NADH-quinone oxidoreductase subunit C
VTSNQSEATVHPLQEYADEVASAVGGTAEITFDTVKVKVPIDQWVEAHRVARDDLGLVFFSWLSAVEWANEVAGGYPLSEEVEERIELLTTLGDLTEGRRVTFSTDLPTEGPVAPSLVDVFAGANWHEREAFEMFGIDFDGHPNLTHLYLPESFVGNPLRKSFPLLSREVKPWPGTVDVEAMPSQDDDADDDDATDDDGPSTENPEA